MFVLLVLCLLVGCAIVLPLLLVGLVLRLVLGVVILPFRLAWLVVRLGAGLIFGVLGLVLTASMLILIPLLPVIALAGAIWLIVRIVKGRPVARLAAG